MSKKKTLNKAPSKMTVGELCDELSIRAEEHGALPAWIVKMYAEDIRSAMKKFMSLPKAVGVLITEKILGAENKEIDGLGFVVEDEGFRLKAIDDWVWHDRYVIIPAIYFNRVCTNEREAK